ncbi:unnamed protein product [Rotaria magnacalcarata]|uniref:Uncharacterized protein n=2 Tax=Rotaria magnacalcarata TaxID=392030 RepID=A0A816DNL9_9BILA|nr:unnamed protein product [Rotaria magnacalcarata]
MLGPRKCTLNNLQQFSTHLLFTAHSSTLLLLELEYVSGDLIPSHNRSIKPLSFILNDEHSDDDSTIEPNDLNLLVEMTPVVNSHLSTLPSDHRKSLSKRSSVARTHRNRKRNLTRRYSCY